MTIPQFGCATVRPQQPTTRRIVSARQLTQHGKHAANRGQWQTAEANFARAVQLAPDDLEPRRQLARCLWRRGATRQAIDQLSYVVQQAQRPTADDLVELGMMRLRVGEPGSALQLADAALRLDPHGSPAWRLRGHVLWKQGDRIQALAHLHRALSLDTGHSPLYLEIAQLYEQMGRPERELATLCHLAQQYPDDQIPADVLYRQASALVRLKRYADCEAKLTAALAAGYSAVPVRTLLAQVQWAQGKLGAAHESLRMALAEATPDQQALLREMLTRLAQSDLIPPSPRRL